MISTSRIIIVMYRYPLVIEQNYRNLPMYWWFMKIYLWFTFKNWWIISVPKTFNHQMAPSLNVSWSGFLKIFTGMVFTMFVSHVFFWAFSEKNMVPAIHGSFREFHRRRMCFHQLSLIDTFSGLTATEVGDGCCEAGLAPKKRFELEILWFF